MRTLRTVASLACLVVSASCAPGEDGLECGPGTRELDGRCELEADGEGSGPICGGGTVELDGQCVPDPDPSWYELRAQVADIPADGIAKIPILAIGGHADGSAADDEVVLSVSREDGGDLLSSAATLGDLGAVVYFRPCNAMLEAGCAGPVELRMALADDPENPVATLELGLAEPAPVYTAGPCLEGGSAMLFDGSGLIYTGRLEVTEGVWSTYEATAALIEIEVTPADPADGEYWAFAFSSEQLDLPLVPGVYELAEAQASESAYRPGMYVAGNGLGCNRIAGRFQVHEYERSGGAVDSVTISFEQHCEPYDEEPQGLLRGCVHYEP
jgi:hypothetical protein